MQSKQKAIDKNKVQKKKRIKEDENRAIS